MDIFLGQEGPGNYWFALVQIDDYSAPPHRHNFDQVRYMLDGGFAFGDQVQPEGSVGYFTAGVTYTQRSEGPNVHLLLQCEGGGRATYISSAQLDRAVESLKARGRFENGRYIDDSKPDARPRDGFEVCWEEAVGRRVEYTPPRFDRPLIMSPEAFAFVPDPDQPGVARKLLGRFTERRLEIGFLRLEAGATARLDVEPVDTLFYVRSGGGQANPDVSGPDWVKDDALRLRAGESGSLKAVEPSDIFYVRLPA